MAIELVEIDDDGYCTKCSVKVGNATRHQDFHIRLQIMEEDIYELKSLMFEMDLDVSGLKQRLKSSDQA